MKYSNIIYDDMANGIGVRTSLFVSGCRLHCKGCFNKDAQNFDYGKEFTKEVEDEIINSIDSIRAGISLLGGEPTEPENAKVLAPFVKRFKEIHPDKNIWLYSGRKYASLKTSPNEDIQTLLKYCDVLVDGRFIESKKDASLAFRGSSNQNIINLNN